MTELKEIRERDRGWHFQEGMKPLPQSHEETRLDRRYLLALLQEGKEILEELRQFSMLNELRERTVEWLEAVNDE